MTSPSLLIIGGSGFVSGTLARRALDSGWAVWTVTRGQRAVVDGVTPIIADRRDTPAFGEAIGNLGRTWDLVVDCIAFEPEDAANDIAVLRGRADQFVLISTDFVFDPARRVFPQPEEGAYVATGYGGKKRQCELLLAQVDVAALPWTVLRPCHIYGPGSQLGCLPRHARDPDLIAHLRRGDPLALVGGGHFLQQPILARDLADLILSVHGKANCAGQTYMAAGPDIVESATYYRVIADILDAPCTISEIPVTEHLVAHPESAPFLCHRIYDLGRLEAAGLAAPSTPLREGLSEHVAALLA